MLPAASKAASRGPLTCAAPAWPPSPEKPAVPVPVRLVITPFAPTMRTRLSLGSGITRRPSEDDAIPTGPGMPAAVAAPPSPLDVAAPVPA